MKEYCSSTFIYCEIHSRLQMRTVKELCAPLRTGRIDEFWQFLQYFDVRSWEVPLRAMVTLIATKTTPEMASALLTSIDWRIEDQERKGKSSPSWKEDAFERYHQRCDQWEHAKEKARLDYATPEASTPSKGGRRL